MHRVLLPCAAVLACGLLLAVAAPAQAEEAHEVPSALDLVLDGRLDEAAWGDALDLPAEPVQVPDVAAPGRHREVRPRVRLLQDGAFLWIGVEVKESPGAALGLHVFVAAPGDLTAADAWGLTYRPLELRADRLRLRGMDADALSAVDVDAACDISQAASWSLELRFPLAVVDDDLAAPRRLAVAVLTRTPNVVATAPPGTLATGPDAWFALAAPAAGWRAAPAPDVARVAAEIAREARRVRTVGAWYDVLYGSPGVDLDPAQRGAALLTARRWFQAPLEALLEARPDLFVPLETMRGDVLERLGLLDSAEAAYRRALAASPGWNEARYGLDVRLAARRLLDGRAGDATDWAATSAAIEAAAGAAGPEADAWTRAGLDLARAEVAYATGRFHDAWPLVEDLGTRFPADAWIHQLRTRVSVEREQEAAERRLRATAPAVPRPRVRIATPHGPVVVELFEDEAPQAVAQWMWLVENGFYDRTAIHHTVPGRWTLGGDPGSHADASPEASAEQGLGGPGYVVACEASPRRAWRGSLALERPAEDVVGSRFALLTGCATEAADAFVVIGQVVEGLEAVDALTRFDEIERIEILSRRPTTMYRPLGLDGAPVPRPTPAR